jgi:hypothetical protein
VTPYPPTPALPQFAPAYQAAPASRPNVPIPGWGWIEWVTLLQTIMPALLFIPVIAHSKMRVVLRVGAFGVSILAWAFLRTSSRPAAGRPFPSQAWLSASSVLLVLEIFHPTSNSFLSALAECLLNIAILLPAYWASYGRITVPRVNRVMFLLLLANGASALMGIAQFYQPDRFNPPVIPLLEANKTNKHDLSFVAADGRRVLRPCGLTDLPGGAGLGGAMASLIGLAWALGTTTRLKRFVALVLTAAGLAAIMLCQSRMMFVGQFLSFGIVALLLLVQRDYRRLRRMGAVIFIVCVAAVGWVIREGGEGVTNRYYTLIEERPTEVYAKNRGSHLQATFENVIWWWPLGAGMGRWGVVNTYFGNPNVGYEQGGQIHVEIQWTGWALDGGIPLMILYATAIILATKSMLHVARRCRDSELALWGAVLVALSVTMVAGCFVGCPFAAPMGLQYWVLVTMVYTAAQRAGFGPRAGSRPPPGHSAIRPRMA